MRIRPKKRKAKPLIFACGDKGGTGKSFFARVVNGKLREYSYAVVGFDGDTRNGHLSRFHCDTQRGSLRTTEGWTSFYRFLQSSSPDSLVLVDTPGGIGDMMASETERLKLLADKLDRDIIVVWVASEEEDSIWLLKTSVAVAGASKTMFVMNGRFAPNVESFTLWNGSKTRADFIADGGSEAFLPVLPIDPRTRIAEARCSFDNVTAASLDPIETIDFEIWWKSLDQELAGFVKLLEAFA